MTRLLRTTGKGYFEEIEWECPEPTENEIQVKAIMTGVCRSDIDMMVGKFGPLPDNMSGHEGLGQVIKVGSALKNIDLGDYVATRGEPAYADVYNSRIGEFVKVPEASSKYIIEPVACGINLVMQPYYQLRKLPKHTNKILIIGSGFLAWTAFHTVKTILTDMSSYSVHVVGHHNSQHWLKVGIKLLNSIPDECYDFIIDLSSNDEVFQKQYLSPNGILILAAEKHPTINTTFSYLLWNSNSIFCPSPRNEYFITAMQFAVRNLELNNFSVDHYWSKGYNRNTEWKQAFEDGLNRPKNYSRGYIYWP